VLKTKHQKTLADDVLSDIDGLLSSDDEQSISLSTKIKAEEK